MGPLFRLSQDEPSSGWHFLSHRLPSIVGFSRASSAQNYTISGVLETLGSNAPRFRYDLVTRKALGLVIEAQRTNLHVYSSSIASWLNVAPIISKTNDVYLSPSGTQNAGQIVVGADSKGVYHTVSGLAPNTAYAISGFVKSFDGVNVLKVGPETAEDAPYQGFIAINTSTGAVPFYGTKAYGRQTVLLGNGWVYFRYYVKTGAAQTSFNFICLASGGGATFSIWGAQVEMGAIATAPIATNGSAATRAADQLSFTVPKGVSVLRYVFDDNSAQDVAVSAGGYTVPTDLNRQCIKRIFSL